MIGKHLLTLLSTFVFLLAGCTSKTPLGPKDTPQTTASTQTTISPLATKIVEGSAYPAPNEIPTAYPNASEDQGISDGNTFNQISETVVSANEGALQITLLYPGNHPVRGQIFFATELLPVGGELQGSYLPALDTETAPRGESDDNGLVTVSLIPPGKYALAVMTPFGPAMVLDTSGDEIIFDIVANQVTEMETQIVSLDANQLEP